MMTDDQLLDMLTDRIERISAGRPWLDTDGKVHTGRGNPPLTDDELEEMAFAVRYAKMLENPRKYLSGIGLWTEDSV